jgi:hypothetical protein
MSPHDVPLDSALAVFLINLRAQYEAQLRELTGAQLDLELYRSASSDPQRRQSVVGLRAHLRNLKNATESVTDTLAEAIREADELT